MNFCLKCAALSCMVMYAYSMNRAGERGEASFFPHSSSVNAATEQGVPVPSVTSLAHVKQLKKHLKKITFVPPCTVRLPQDLPRHITRYESALGKEHIATIQSLVNLLEKMQKGRMTGSYTEAYQTIKASVQTLQSKITPLLENRKNRLPLESIAE